MEPKEPTPIEDPIGKAVAEIEDYRFMAEIRGGQDWERSAFEEIINRVKSGESKDLIADVKEAKRILDSKQDIR